MSGRLFALCVSTVGVAVTALLGCGKPKGAADSTVTTDTAKSRASSSTAALNTRGATRHVIVFAGTSLTAGLGLSPDSAYPMLIQRKIDSAGLPFDVTNAGVSGETSSGLLDRLDWLMRGKFDVFVLETGANDMLRGVPVATLRQNLGAAIDRIKAARPDAHIALVQMEALPNLGSQYAGGIHSAYAGVAQQKHVMLMPFLLDHVAGNRDLNQADGVHPNDAGERIVAENVWRALRPVLDSIVGAR